MTTVFNDNVQTTMTIGEDEWLVAEAEVVLSQIDTPNYADINKMVPSENVKVPSPPDELVGNDFELHADNDLISERNTDKSEETLLFKGKLANISAIGTRAYEGIAYDPSQQPVADSSGGGFGSNGSIMNQKIYVTNPYYGVAYTFGIPTGTEYEPKTTKGAAIVDKIANEIPGVDEVDNQLTEGGVTRKGPNGSVTGAYNRELSFDKFKISLQRAIEKVREQCECDWWFDKEGVLHFGVPDPIAHELRFITDASDGVTTPPYQSVKVIGSGVATEEGFNRTQLVADERITAKATWITPSPGEHQPVLDDNIDGELPTPTFEYRNAEISTQAQADSTAKKLVDDLAKQQADGEITVVGFPEVEPYDALVMPHASEKKRDAGVPNYQEGMPMGGNRYGVYKVTHRLNGSDGFKTKLNVSGLTGSARIAVPFQDNKPILIDRGDWADMSPQTRTLAQAADMLGLTAPTQ